MERVITMVVSRSWKDPFSDRELADLSAALTAAAQNAEHPLIRIRSVKTDDSEELHVTVQEA